MHIENSKVGLKTITCCLGHAYANKSSRLIFKILFLKLPLCYDSSQTTVNKIYFISLGLLQSSWFVSNVEDCQSSWRMSAEDSRRRCWNAQVGLISRWYLNTPHAKDSSNCSRRGDCKICSSSQDSILISSLIDRKNLQAMMSLPL